ncbi:MAG: methyltransferase domain-containing protein [Dehalococcoidia bacterium]|jgi:tRNA (cmo5U34)-methyltransferase|nr:methyltransferase domain-containing protein [Dehalococcoidia bacterium]
MAATQTDTGHHQAEGERWAFDESVTAVFDDMLERSIPEYEEMRRASTEFASVWIANDLEATSGPPTVLDLGASNGGSLARLVAAFGSQARYEAIEVSEAMREQFAARFGSLLDGEDPTVRLLDGDLREGLPGGFGRTAVVQSILTLMFTPLEYRHRIVQEVHDRLDDGGCFLLVEKIIGADALLDGLFTDAYYAFKERSGYSREEIDRKRFALEGVQVPVTARWNEELLTAAGFRSVDCYWRSGKFAAWVAVKR